MSEGIEPAGGTGEPVPRIRLRGIVKQFGSIQALRGVDLDLWPGEVLGLVGDNAAGKSTLTKIIAGTYVADDGRMEIDGREVRFATPADAKAQAIEMVYQDLSLCDTVDVAGNLFLGREPMRRVLGLPWLDKGRMQREARAHLEALDIHIPNVKALVAQLSGGQRQSIAIARAAAFQPRTLIMDEPTSALAVAEVDAVLRLIRKLAEQGVSIILITHRLQDLFRVCDRIAVMYEGLKIAERRIDETDLEDLVHLIVGEKLRGHEGRAAHGH
ncbi:MAG: sugar ABC transporter ATP-binding protein [Geminicoccaceae bacterium]|nr:MAG: sugar ABC transporter ATP-binding protein [Geminicoccaceae bacterium]